MAKRRFKVAVNGDINNASNRPAIQNIPEEVGCLGDKFYYHMPMCWDYDSTKKKPPMGTARIHNGASQLEGCRRNALVLTAEIAVFLCSTDNYKRLAFVKNGRAIIIPESPDGYFNSVECDKDTFTIIENLREYFKHNAVSWETLTQNHIVYKWGKLKHDIEYLFLVGGIA